LGAFLETADTIAHDKKVCLGDMVGYGADPNPCVELIRDRADLILAGNHDYAAVGKTDVSYFNPDAYKACIWTHDELTDDNKEFLRSLPVRKLEGGIFWAHSSPFQPLAWHYIFSAVDGARNFDYFDASVCFVGHTHKPIILQKDPAGQIETCSGSFWKLRPGNRYIINAGSIGQPRDGNPDPSFGIYDTESGTIEIRRFSYDRSTARKKILENGLPPFLAERLDLGL
ncbi:MAG: metallophosphoesterase family protein, partial [Nitrospinales bacterium]